MSPLFLNHPDGTIDFESGLRHVRNSTGLINGIGYSGEADILAPEHGVEELATTSAKSAETDKNWLKITKKALVGAAAAGVAVGSVIGFANNHSEEQLRDTVEAIPAVAATVGVAEAFWIGGAGMALTGAALGARRRGKIVTVDIRNVKDSFNNLRQAGPEIFARDDVRRGVLINTAAATVQAGALALGTVAALPPEAWAGGLSLAAIDFATTIAVRAPIAAGIKSARSNPDVMKAEMARREQEKAPKVNIRKIKEQDIRRLAEIDLDIFAGAYGEDKPSVEELEDRFTRRFHNTDLWYVVEIDGQVEGSIAAMRTNKPHDQFKSWEDTTNNGTFDDRVDPDGQYLYVANLGVTPKCTSVGATDILTGVLIAEATKDTRIKSGYLESRMPGLKNWLTRNGGIPEDVAELDAKVREYAETRTKDGKRIDGLLRKYETIGCEMIRIYSGAYKDEDSLNYGAVFTANVLGPQNLRENYVARKVIGGLVATALKFPNTILAADRVVTTAKTIFKKSPKHRTGVNKASFAKAV